jgi:hypothetical protein
MKPLSATAKKKIARFSKRRKEPQSARVESMAKPGHHAGAFFDLKKDE